MKPRYNGPPSDHFDGERFFSPYGEPPKTLLDVLKWKLGGPGATQWPAEIPNTAEAKLPDRVENGSVVCTFVNHATMLIQTPTLNLLTDPVFSERVSPFTFAGPKRVRKPGLTIDRLPRIDVVLVSHNHYDHLDQRSLKGLNERFKPRVLTGLGDRRFIPDAEELDWWQSVKIGDTTLTYLPAQHWSARGVSDRNLSLWGSFMIESPGFTTYFAGDTGYAKHFSEIANRFPQIDLALLPIGAYEPRWFMRSQHMNPDDAVQAHQDLKATQSLGIHFGTWQLTDEGVDEPVAKLQRSAERAGLQTAEFSVLDQGESRQFRR